MVTEAEDFNAKQALENDFMRKMMLFNQDLVRQSRNAQLRGLPFTARQMQPELQAILSEHYDDVGNIFDHEISDDLADDIAETPEERDAINGILAIFFANRTIAQSEIITATNQKDMTDSVTLGLEAAREDAGPSVVVTVIDAAILTSVFLNRKLSSRAGTIAITETQTPAEAAKLTEAQVLSGRGPDINGTNITRSTPLEPTPDPTKKWITRGDERVRTTPFNHAAADGQTRPVDGVFNVSGESMRFPKDPHLGASVGNIINCRCRATYNLDEISANRRAAGPPLIITIETGA